MRIQRSPPSPHQAEPLKSLPIVLIVVALILLSGIRIAQEYEWAIVFRLGRFTVLRGPGLYWIIPVIERRVTIDIRTKTMDLE